MILYDNIKLDNPVWHSLNENHKSFSISFGKLGCYQPDACPFAGYAGGPEISPEIEEYSKLINNFFIVGERPEFPRNLKLARELVCLQMVLDRSLDLEIHENIVVLNNQHEKETFDLVNLVQPGYFMARTINLGNYYGIFKNGILVAVAGERMKMDGFTEVSAIVTHPDHTGNGYAKQLIAHTTSKIFEEKKLPYLHVSETNLGPPVYIKSWALTQGER